MDSSFPDNCYGDLQKCYGELYDCNNDYDAMIQHNLDAPMPWIGMYIAAASAICSLAMAADVFRGFRSKKPWLPCKYFSLNAASLTLLTVATKLSVDLTSSMMGTYDKIASVGSLVLVSTAVGNFTTSVSSMDGNEVLLNLTALGILVVTIAANVCIHNVQTRDVLDGQVVLAEEIGALIFMLLLTLILCFSAMVVPTTKRHVELRYREMHKILSANRTPQFSDEEELRVTVRKYWVMAETGSPQFVMARSVISGIFGLICLLMALTFVEAYVRVRLLYSYFGRTRSNYKWSINYILYIQFLGVAFGTIAPLMRWCVASWFRISELGQKSLREELKIEKYWTLRLVEWREKPLPLQIRHRRCRKLLHEAKKLLLSICSGVLVFFVLASKIFVFVSAKFGEAIFLCFLLTNSRLNLKAREASDNGVEIDLSPYVLLLEGEERLPKRILNNICNELDKCIEKGERKNLKNLQKLLKKSVNFNGVREFDRNEVPSLHSQEPPNCWSLPLVTLASIAIALPNVAIDEANQLVSGVAEGLPLVKLVEKTLGKTGDMEGIRDAAEKVWVGVELYRKWQDKDVHNASIRGRNYVETLQNLSNLGEETVKDFTTKIQDVPMQNPLSWPSKVIAANSMYRVTQTMLLANREKRHQTEGELFERLSIMISDILAACLTNLAHVIIFKCHNNAVKDRQDSVREAAVLLGESREILRFLQLHDLPGLDPQKAANIEEWRASMA